MQSRTEITAARPAPQRYLPECASDAQTLRAVRQNGTFFDSLQTGESRVGSRAFRGLTRSAPSGSRARRKLPDGNFRRSLVGSLRALTSAEMVALMCNTAARTGFLLGALHSVAERVNPRKARPPAPH